MVLSIVELSELQDQIVNRLPDEILAILVKLNRTGRLKEWLDMMNMSDLLQGEDEFYSYKHGKIVLIGGNKVKEDVLLGVAKKHGHEKSRFEFCLDYNQI